MNIRFIKSSYDVPQHGTFEQFRVIDSEIEGSFLEKVLFSWSDNNGLVSHISGIDKYGEKAQFVYNEMCRAEDEANAIWRKENEDLPEGHGTVIVYSREGRTNEFGVEWEKNISH